MNAGEILALVAKARKQSKHLRKLELSGAELLDELADGLEQLAGVQRDRDLTAAENKELLEENLQLSALTVPDGDEAAARIRAKLDRIPDLDTVALDKTDVRALLARAAVPDGDARDVALERAFMRWRDHEIDRTGVLPEGYALFKAGWQRASAAMQGEHDHIEDGATYLDCAACEFATASQPALEAVIGVLMGLPISVRRDTTELGRAILAAFPVLSRDIAGEIDAEASRYAGPFEKGLRRAAEIARNGR